MQPLNTPPDGDFVRYLEQLTAAQAAPKDGAAAGVPMAVAVSPSVKAGQPSVAYIPFLRHAKWVVGLWVAAQILAWFVPGAGFLFIPLLAVYAVWVIYRHRSRPPGAFIQELAARARRAAEAARKVSSTLPKNKP